jgi:hypothetical protein
MAVGMILGGVTAGEFWRHTFALVNLLWVSVCVGLLASVFTRESGRSLVYGGMALLLLTVGWPWLAAIVRQASLSPALDWLWAMSPVEAFSHADHGYFSTRPDRYWRALAVSHGVGWGCLGVAAWWLPRAWQDRPAETAELAPRARRDWRPMADQINPVARLARPTRREQALVWTITGVTLAVAAGWALTGNFGMTFPIWGSPWFSPALLLLKGVFTWRCCVFFHGLRHGAGELLLTTPLREMQLIGGGWATARSLVQKPLIVLVVAYALTSILSGLVARRLKPVEEFRVRVGEANRAGQFAKTPLDGRVGGEPGGPLGNQAQGEDDERDRNWTVPATQLMHDSGNVGAVTARPPPLCPLPPEARGAITGKNLADSRPVTARQVGLVSRSRRKEALTFGREWSLVTSSPLEAGLLDGPSMNFPDFHPVGVRLQIPGCGAQGEPAAVG